MAAKNKSNEINIIRVYDAPVEAVWDAWTDPEQVAQWWGPRGFTLTTKSKDVRTGGHWIYTMHGPDGTDYPNKTYYHEVEKHSKLVYDHGGNDDQPPMFKVTVLFSETKGKTKMDMTMSLETPEKAEETRKFIKKAGGNSTWDRLAEYLEKKESGKEKFVINRTFDAPIELVFEMWINPHHFAQWMGPVGSKLQFIRSDIKVGGSSFSFFANENDPPKMYVHHDFLAIEKPNRIVYSGYFCDENEKISRHPFSNTWPETMLTTVVFSEEGPERTRVTLTWEPQGTLTNEDLETFTKGRDGATQGWTGTFDKLEDYLSVAV
jgi:uncharacterized protein YndB with AHSA1/START domain